MRNKNPLHKQSEKSVHVVLKETCSNSQLYGACKYFRSKDSMSMSEMSRNSHPHPYVLSQMQPYYGPNHHRNSQNNQNSQYPVSQSEWDDTHFRWPSPSLPPTLKKGQNKHHFGTLDKGEIFDF